MHHVRYKQLHWDWIPSNGMGCCILLSQQPDSQAQALTLWLDLVQWNCIWHEHWYCFSYLTFWPFISFMFHFSFYSYYLNPCIPYLVPQFEDQLEYWALFSFPSFLSTGQHSERWLVQSYAKPRPASSPGQNQLWQLLEYLYGIVMVFCVIHIYIITIYMLWIPWAGSVTNTGYTYCTAGTTWWEDQ